MSVDIVCCILYGIASVIIIVIFISLSRHLLCPNPSKSVPNKSQRSNSNNVNSQTNPTPNSNNNNINLATHISFSNNNHNRAPSVSSVADIGRRISLPTNISIPNDASNTTTTTATPNTATPNTATAPNSTPKNNDANSNSSITSTVKSPSNASRSHTRFDSMQILVSNIKGILYKVEHKGYESNEIQLLVRISSIMSVFGFLICAFMICIYFMIQSISNQDNNNTYEVIKVWSLVFYCIGKYALYLCSISRLYYTLVGGIYQYNNIIYAMIIIYLMVDFIITISAILFVYIGTYTIFIVCILIFYFLDIFYLILLYALFTKQLLSLINNTPTYIHRKTAHNNNTDIAIELQISPSPSASSVCENTADKAESESNNKSKGSETKNKDSAYIHKHKTSGIEYVTKYSVLILWSVISSLAMITMISVLNVDFIYKFNENIMIHIMLSFDCIINSSAIYLYFIFGGWIYKLLCGICHNITSKSCDKLINRIH